MDTTVRVARPCRFGKGVVLRLLAHVPSKTHGVPHNFGVSGKGLRVFVMSSRRNDLLTSDRQELRASGPRQRFARWIEKSQ